MARRTAARERADPSHDHIIATLTFGFWPWLFARNYDDALWRPALRHAFPAARRSHLHRELTAVGVLRNRIAHHEPLIQLDLESEYARVLRTAEWIEPRLGWWIDTTSRVDAVRRSSPLAEPRAA